MASEQKRYNWREGKGPAKAEGRGGGGKMKGGIQHELSTMACDSVIRKAVILHTNKNNKNMHWSSSFLLQNLKG